MQNDHRKLHMICEAFKLSLLAGLPGLFGNTFVLPTDLQDASISGPFASEN